tara:strand:+ start:8595 stop:12482 length:3888 start_codon:yes stop_codon:yes gene_type:complete
MPKINPDIPASSVQYFSNARGVNYLPSLDTEWKESGYLPRPDFVTAFDLNAKGNSDGLPPPPIFTEIGKAESNIFVGVNPASIWYYYNESDHEKGLIKLKKLGINCIRTPLFYDIYHFNATSYLENVKSFLKMCDRHNIRVQFVLWDSEQSIRTISSVSGNVLIPEQATPNLTTALTLEKARNPNITLAASPSFFTASAGPYIDALASSVSSYQSMWCFDLCNKPTSEFLNLAVSSQARLNQNLSSTNIKYTFSPKDGLNIFNDTDYLDNGRGTGPSGSYGIEDIKTFSSLIDFVSVPFIANNDYAFNRYLNGSISGTSSSGINKPFMVYAAYDPEVSQNLNTTLDVLQASSVGYFNNLGVIDSPFSFGFDKLKFGNIYSDGEYRDLKAANSLLLKAQDANWFNRRDISKAANLKEKQESSFSGTSNELTTLDRSVSTKAVQSWDILKNYYVNAGPNLLEGLGRSDKASQKFKAGFDSEFSQSVNHNVMASSFNDNSLEENLRILYNFDTHFPPLSNFTFSVSGDNWQKINESMVIRNGFLQSLAKFVVDYDSDTVGYAELRNSTYDTNPIPDYERGVLTELIEFMTDSFTIQSGGKKGEVWTRNPTTTKIKDLSSTFTYEYAYAFYGVSDSGTDFSNYYDNYYEKLVDQLKKCLMWIYWKGTTDTEFKIVSDSFLDDISFVASSISSVEIYDSTVTGTDTYTPGSLDSVKSPIYTVEVYNPSTSVWNSSFVTVVSGQDRQITGDQSTGPFSSYGIGVSGSNAPISFTTFGTSGIAKVRVKKTNSQSITSSEVYPKRSSKSRQPSIFTFGDTSLRGIEFTTYIGDKLYIEIDGNTSAPLCIFADPFKPAIPSGLTTYAGQNRASYSNEPGLDLTSSTNSYNRVNWDASADRFTSYPNSLYFPPGVHNLSAGLPLSSNTVVYIDANAYIKGGFDLVSGYDCRFLGRGLISAEMYPRQPFIESVKSDISDDAAGFYMPIGISVSSVSEQYPGSTSSQWPGAVVEGLVLANQAFYGTGRYACNSFDNCKHLAPYTFNSDGLKASPKCQYSLYGVTNSMMLCGDDTMTPFTYLYRAPSYYRNNFVGSFRSSVVATYFGGGLTNRAIIKDIDILNYSWSGSVTDASKTPITGNALINMYTDFEDGLTFDCGLGNVEISNWDLHQGDGSAIYMGMYHIANQNYIYQTRDGSACGVVSGINITNINLNPSALNPPDSLATSSAIYGLSAGPTPAQTAAGSPQSANRPMNITFTNFKIGSDTFLTDTNVDDFTLWYNPVSATLSVTDPDSASGAGSNIVFKTT